MQLLNALPLAGFRFGANPHPRYKYIVVDGAGHRIRAPHNGPVIRLMSGDFCCGHYHSGRLYVAAGYVYDGATCAPDLAKGMRAFALHDLACQFQCVDGFPAWVISRREADDMMLNIMREDGVGWLARQAYKLVRLGGLVTPRKHEGLSLMMFDETQALELPLPKGRGFHP